MQKFNFSRYSRLFCSNAAMGRGALIVFEGLDRSGKSTQCQKLIESLEKRNIPCQIQRFPDRTTAIGKMISSYLTQQTELEDHAVHLLFTANRWEASKRMRELLEKGVTVIVDRYSYSGVVYTAAKKGFSIDWCKQPEVGLPRPDLVLFLCTRAQVLASRAEFGDERYETAAFQARVLENYIQLKEDNWTEIDANRDIDGIHKEIIEKVCVEIERVKNEPIKGLWTSETVQKSITNGHNGHISELEITK